MKTSGATNSVSGLSDRLRSWIAHHRRVCLSTISDLLKNLMSSLLTWLVIGIALALPSILFIILSSVAQIGAGWGGNPSVSVYLQTDLEEKAGKSLANEIVDSNYVENVRFVSRDVALKDFQERSGLRDVLSSLNRNPLPHVIEVNLVSSDPLVLSDLKSLWLRDNRIAKVVIDLAWLERLNALLTFVERLVWILALILGLGVILIIGNTIRLAIENRRQEIEVTKLFGATDSFVRRPFLYLGFWFGVGGALIAMIFLQLSLVLLSEPMETLAQSYREDFALGGLGANGFFLLLGAGAIMGIVGAAVAVSRHLKVSEPR